MDFSITRLFNLIKKDFIISKKFLLLLIVSLVAVCALLVFFTSDGVPMNSNQVPPDAGEIVFGVLLIIGGSVITATIFREFRNPPERLKFLSLPASNFEKVFSKWLYTLPFYFLVVCVIFIVGYPLFSSLIGSWIDVEYVHLQELRPKYFGYLGLSYFLVHSGIFMFSLFYNRFPLPKIIVTGFFLAIAGFAVIALLTRIIFYDHFQGFFRGTELMFSKQLSNDFQIWMEMFLLKLPYRFAMIGVPFIWLISYFKMKEKEL